MVKGSENLLYLKLKERFEKLSLKQTFVSKVLQTWENEGIERAMELYYSKNINNNLDNSNTDFELSNDFDKLIL
jgi:hypothetical protein